MRYLGLIALSVMFIGHVALCAQDGAASNETQAIQKDGEKKTGEIAKRNVATEAAGYKTDGLHQTLFKDEDLRRFHAANVSDFVSIDGYFGISRVPFMNRPSFSLRSTIEKPNASQTAASARTQVIYYLASRELIGLLAHPSPVAYDAPNLKGMMEGSAPKPGTLDTPARALDDFETKALATLRTGQDIVMDKSGDSVRLVGSIRASADCMSCHECKTGDLLGAFSYRLNPNREMLPSKIAAKDTSDTQGPGRYRTVLKDHGATKILEKMK